MWDGILSTLPSFIHGSDMSASRWVPGRCVRAHRFDNADNEP